MTQEALSYEHTDEDEAITAQMAHVVDSYDSYMRKMTLGRERKLRDLTVKWAQVGPGDSVLEVGCGTGSLTLAAKRQTGPSGSVCGIDVLPGMIEQSRRKAAEAGAEIDFRLGSINAIPHADDHFDVVLCSFMIFHTSELVRRQGIAEIRRVLKPGGRLMVIDLGLPPKPLPRKIASLLFRWVKDDVGDLRPLLHASGFADVQVVPAPFRVFGFQLIALLRAQKGPLTSSRSIQETPDLVAKVRELSS
jgi:ubiquinone/menaquinone biosynthesis C-methylase UbiE